MQVAPGVDGDQGADDGDQQPKQQAQAIQSEGHGDADLGQPFEVRRHDAAVGHMTHVAEQPDRDGQGDRGQDERYEFRGLAVKRGRQETSGESKEDQDQEFHQKRPRAPEGSPPDRPVIGPTQRALYWVSVARGAAAPFGAQRLCRGPKWAALSLAHGFVV